MLRQKAKSAVIWSGADLLLRQGIGFAISIFLARLLVPEDFGTIALLSIFLGIAGLFVNAGFSAALIQKQDTTHIDESTVFWFNIAAGVGVTASLIGLAPLLAAFFEMPVLAPLTILLACNILITATGSIHSTLMTKRLDFRTPLKIGFVASLCSGSVGVYLAWAHYGVWALAGQALTASLVGTVMLWYYSPWLPLWTFSRDSFRRLFRFSGYVFAAGLLEAIYQNGHTMLVGKLFGVRDLGFFNRANSTQQLAVELPSGVVSRVTFPLYSSLNGDRKKLHDTVRLSVRSIMLVTSPLMFGLAILSEPFIRLVFGDQWGPAVPILQVLCIGGLFFPLHDVNVSFLKAQGKADLNFRLNVIKKLTGITLLGIGALYGVIGVAWGCAIQSVIALLINGYYTKRLLGYSMQDQIKDCLPALTISAAMAAFVAVADLYITKSGALELILLVALGSAFYVVCNVFFGTAAFKDIVRFMKSGAGSKAVKYS